MPLRPTMDLVATVDLRPLPVTTAPARRVPQLLGGLVLYGTSMAMQLRATLGLDPWDVFHQGLARHLSLSFGTVTANTGVAVLLLWIPLRQRPGIGTFLLDFRNGARRCQKCPESRAAASFKRQ